MVKHINRQEKADYCYNVLLYGVVIPNMCGIHTPSILVSINKAIFAPCPKPNFLCFLLLLVWWPDIWFQDTCSNLKPDFHCCGCSTGCREIYFVSRYLIWNVKRDLLLQTALARGSATSGFPGLVLHCNGACHHHNGQHHDDNALCFLLVKMTIMMIADKPKSIPKEFNSTSY